jgi:transcriptional regulator with XRE-family HTH domain
MRAARNHATNLSHVKRHKLHEIKRPAKRGQQPNLEKLPAIQPRELPPKIGARFHELRKARCLTLEQVQTMSGISKSMLSQIERGRANPTFATLWHLTQSLGIDIGDLVYKVKLAAGRSREMEHMRIHSTPSVISIDGKCKFRILRPRRFMLPLEWDEITMVPGGGSRANPRSATRTWCCKRARHCRIGRKSPRRQKRQQACRYGKSWC